MSKTHRGYQSEIGDLFSKLNLWMEESLRQFSSIIDSHKKSISEGVNDLVEEVDKLQTELSAIKKENTVLIETVSSLNGEIRRHSAKAARNIETENNRDPNDDDGCEVEATDRPEHDVDRLGNQGVRNEDDDFKDDILFLNNKINLVDSSHNEMLNADEEVSNNEVNTADQREEDNARMDKRKQQPPCSISGESLQNESDEETTSLPKKSNLSEDYVCQECSFVFPTEDNLRIHMRNIHSKFDHSEMVLREVNDTSDPSNNYDKTVKKEASTNCGESVKQVGDTKFECDLCPFTSATQFRMTGHIRGVHVKIENHVCEDKCDRCPFKAYLRSTLKKHTDTVHDKIRNHVCKLCPYRSAKLSNLKQHIETVHEKSRKYVCKQCGQAFHTKSNLKPHIESVHEKKKDHVCNECGKAFTKKALKVHIRGVHQKIRNFACGECGHAFLQKGDLKRHQKRHEPVQITPKTEYKE